MSDNNDACDVYALARDLDKHYFQMLTPDDGTSTELVRIGGARLSLLDPDDFDLIMVDIPGCIRVCASSDVMQAEAAALTSLYERLKAFAVMMHKQDARFRPQETALDVERER